MSDRTNDDVVRGFDLKLIPKLFAILEPYKATVVLTLVALAVSSVAELAVPVLIQNGIDQGVLKNDVAHLTLVAWILAAMLVVSLLTSFYQVYFLSKVNQDVMKDLRTTLFAHFQRQSSKYLHDTPLGKLISGVTSDVSTLSEFFNTLFTSLLKDTVMMIGVVITLFVINAQLAFYTVLSLPLVVVLVALFRHWSRKASRKVRAQVSRLTAFLSEHIQGIGIVQIFAREAKSREEAREVGQALLKANIGELMVNAVFRPLIDVLTAITLGVLIWFATGLSLQNAVTLGSIVAFVNLVGRFYQPVGSLAENFTALQSAMAGAERVFAYLDDDRTIEDRGTVSVAELPDTSVEFRNVRFSYTADEPVLRDLSFRVESGQTVAIVGYTGAGKTTITNLLTRLWDIESGSITLGGVDLRSIRLNELRSQIQSVLQDVFLFSGSIASNVDLGRGLARDRIEEIGALVQIDSFVSSLENGWDTELVEGATNLSSGQRQLISFARVLAQNPRVLILDEATSNVDTETEVLIQKALETLLAGRTSLVIAHRLSTIRKAHKILVLDEGRIAEEGTHDELMEKRGFYYNLYKLQYERESEASPAAGSDANDRSR